MILNKIVAVARLTKNPLNASKESYQAVGNMQAIGMNIQPAEADLIAVSEGVYGQTFQAFTSVSGIQVGDQITVSGTADVFIVHGVKNQYYGPIPHLELVLFLGDQ